MESLFSSDVLLEYDYTGDILSMALCLTMGVLLFMCRVQKNTGLKILFGVLLQIFVAAGVHVICQLEMLKPEPSFTLVYICRFVHHVLLVFVLGLYMLYLFEPLWIPHSKRKKAIICCTALIGAGIICDILGSVCGFGFQLRSDGSVHKGLDIFKILFLFFIVRIFYIIIRYRGRLLRPIFTSLIGTMLLSVLLIAAQTISNNLSYTTFAYFIPILSLIFMFHSNPFDVETGAISDVYLLGELQDALEHQTPIVLILCEIRGFFENIKHNKDFKTEYYNFLRANIKNGVLYSTPDGKLLLSLREEKKDDAENAVEKFTQSFLQNYEKFLLEYKITVLKSRSEITSAQDYPKLLDMIANRQPYNEIYHINGGDIEKFYNSSYILSQLEDIARKNSFTDERIIVYCQPVYNIMTGRCDTAEALMRLKLEKTGMVFPDLFIPLAEEHNLIHTLSMIILDKTCAAIRDFLEEGYELKRVSVNFSTSDLRYESFCRDVMHIIDRNGIPYDHIAMEITESQSEADFHLLKEKVLEMQKLGIKFYLDDFGTGYSNFERIMEIPFDIIKFDRSMLLEHKKNESSRYMVNTFAEMFHKLNYTVLFEGVENEKDQETCIQMNAKYLQGYKFSRPIPIASLRDFLYHPEKA